MVDNDTRPGTYAIFEGGGVKGSAHVGALAVTLEHVDVVGVGGTSAGAIIAALYAAGYEPDEMLQMMREMNYRRLARRFPLWFPRRFGLRSSKYIYEWLRLKMAQKVHPESGGPVSFGDDGLRCPIKIVAADVENRRRRVFSKATDHSTEIAHAVRLSMSIPFYYESIADSSGRYVDGGIISNFPLWLFDEERREADDPAMVLGFDLVEIRENRRIRGWRDFASAVVSTSLAEQRRLLEEHLDHPVENTIQIHTGTVKTTDFGISGTQIDDLYQRGKEAAALFFANRFVRVSADSSGALDEVGRADTPAIDVIRLLALNHLYSSQQPTNVGTYSDVCVRYYIDFMEACLVPTSLTALARVMADHVRSQNLRFDAVAGPKRGNPLFIAAVGEELGVKPILVKDNLNSRFGYAFEGFLRRGEVALVIDDISSDGELLRQAVEQLRMHGQTVNSVATLVDRSEGNAREVLNGIQCGLSAVVTLNDQTLAQWLEQAKGFGE